jgi:DNA damage-binding protein 1
MLNKIRPSTSSTDHLFVGTDRAMYFTLSWDPGSRQLQTEKSYLDLADQTARESQFGDRCLIDPTGEFMTLEVYEGIITTIPLVRKGKKKEILESGVPGEPTASRIPEFFVRSSAFLPRPPASGEKPRLALLHEDYDGHILLRIRELGSSGFGGNFTVDFEDDHSGNPSHPMDLGASHLIPIPGPPYGLLILGETSISYFSDSNYTLITRPLDEATIFVAWQRVDNQRYVLADEYGKLYLLMIMLDFTGNVDEWRLDLLGETSRASVLVYLDAGSIFVGSHQGDSQVVRIVEGHHTGSLEVLQTFPNIGPILDFTVMDMGNRSGDGHINEYSSGQARIVTGSGAYQDGSLRSIRSGVGMEELGVIAEMEHVTNLFSLKTNALSEFVDTLLVGFINETRVFFFSADGDVEELAQHKGLILTEQTLLASNLPDAYLLQVTSSIIRVTDLESRIVSSEWRPAGKITAVAATDTHVVVTVDGITIIILDILNNLAIYSQKSFSESEQIACVTSSPSLPNACVVGFWQDSTVSVLDLKTLESLSSTHISDENTMSVPRNLLVTNLFESPHPPTLLVAMADGNVVTFDVDSSFTLTSKKSTILGTQQANFKAIPRGNGLHSVFATCEHPSLIYASEDRIVYSAVQAEKAVTVCSFDAEAYPGAVVIASTEDLRVATIDTERTTHVQTLAVGETVRRIAYSPSLKAFGLGTLKRILRDGAEIIESHFKLADEVLFKELDSYRLKSDELVECVVRADLDDGTGNLAERFMVGTSYLEDAVEDNLRGRILVFEVTEERILKLIAEHSLKGSCRCLAIVEGKIAAALVKTVVVYEFEYPTPSRPVLTKKAAFRTSTAPIDICVTGNLIAVADLMKSVSVVEYKPGVAPAVDELKEVARDYRTTWGTAVANVDPETWLEGDAEGNLIVLARERESDVVGDDSKRLRVIGEMSLGEMVNRIRPIEVVSQPGAAVVPKAFIGTVSTSLLFPVLQVKSEIITNVVDRSMVPSTSLLKYHPPTKTSSWNCNLPSPPSPRPQIQATSILTPTVRSGTRSSRARNR